MKRRAESAAEGNGPLRSTDFILQMFKRKLNFEGEGRNKALQLIPDAVLRDAVLNLFREGGCPDHIWTQLMALKLVGDLGPTILIIDASILSLLKEDDRVEQVYNDYNCKEVINVRHTTSSSSYLLY
jgi:hypothetical protein